MHGENFVNILIFLWNQSVPYYILVYPHGENFVTYLNCLWNQSILCYFFIYWQGENIFPHISISAQSNNLLVHPLCISYATYFESPCAINHVQYLLFGCLRCAVGYNEFDFFFRKLRTQPFSGWTIYLITIFIDFLQKRWKSVWKCTKKVISKTSLMKMRKVEKVHISVMFCIEQLKKKFFFSY